MDRLEQVKKVKEILDKSFKDIADKERVCPQPPTLQEPDQPINCPDDCNICVAKQILDSLYTKPSDECEDCADAFISTHKKATNEIRAKVYREIGE